MAARTKSLGSQAGGRAGGRQPVGCSAEKAVFRELVRARDLNPGSEAEGFRLSTLRGRLTELSSSGPAAGLSLSCSLLLEAQSALACSVWISAGPDTFFPPDLAANGVALSALPVVWAPDVRGACRCADWLLRTGAFALIVVDLHQDPRLPEQLWLRLAQLARRRGTAVVFLTQKPRGASSLGSMISLHAEVSRQRIEDSRFLCRLRVLKDKRRAPGWKHREELGGPPGLC